MRKVFILLMCVLTGFSAMAQKKQAVSSIYLDNGSIIQGQVVEVIPQEVIMIKTSDGSIHSYKMKDVQKVVNNDSVYVTKNLNQTTRGYFGFYGGVSVPTGNPSYMAVQGSPVTAGVSTGGNLTLDFGYNFLEHLGIAVMFTSSVLPSSYTGGTAAEDAVYAKNAFTAVSFFVGPLLSFPLCEKMDWRIRPMFGLMAASSPFVYSNLNNQQPTLPYSSTKFAFDIGSSLHYHVMPKMSVVANADYLTSKTHFTGDTRHIGIFSFTVGVAYRFN